MLILHEPTPNPNTLKFLPGRPVLETGTRDYETAEAATGSPLARSLFELPSVERVFLAGDFLSVTKSDDMDWEHLRALVLPAIMDHFMSGLPVVEDSAAPDTTPTGDTIYEGETAEIVEEIRELLETRVRPAVAQDGGDIIFDHFDKDTGIVRLHMRGACAGCPSSTMTLKQGIENLLRHYVPEVTAVEAAL